MSRSRQLLLAAWAVLAVGAVMHFAWPADDIVSNPEADSRSTGEFIDEPNELAYRDSGRGADRASRATDPTEGGAIADTEAGSDVPEEGNRPGNDPAQSTEPTVPAVDLPAESFVAVVTTDGVAASTEPGGEIYEHWFPNPTQFGSPRVFLVVDQTSSPDFVKVALPAKPNGQEGWIPRFAVDLQPVQHRALINLSTDSVTVWHGDDIIVETAAVTGKPSTPTPVGTFYVRDIIDQPDPDGSFGPYILALSGFSEVLDSFNGGLPALAIHGTDRPEQIGSERSSGCIRIPNDLVTILAQSVPLGTPVTVIA